MHLCISTLRGLLQLYPHLNWITNGFAFLYGIKHPVNAWNLSRIIIDDHGEMWS